MEHYVPASIPYAELGARLFLALVFGALVGIERRLHHKNAGIQTHALVSVGAASYGMISLLGLGPTNNPMLIAGGVVTGIGFIGGGVIMHRGASVQGLNTAATLWAAASMGLAAGAGYLVFACFVLVALLFIQFSLMWAEDWFERVLPSQAGPITYRLTMRMTPSAADLVHAAWTSFVSRTAASVQSMATTQDTDETLMDAEFTVPAAHARDVVALNTTLTSVPGVNRAQLDRVSEDGGGS